MPSDSICMLCNALHFDFQKFCPFLHSRFFSSCFFFPVANFCCIIFFYLNLCLYSFLVLQFSKIAVRIKVFKVDFLCSLLFIIDSYVFFHVLSFLICFSRFLQAVRFDWGLVFFVRIACKINQKLRILMYVEWAPQGRTSPKIFGKLMRIATNDTTALPNAAETQNIEANSSCSTSPPRRNHWTDFGRVRPSSLKHVAYQVDGLPPAFS